MMALASATELNGNSVQDRTPMRNYLVPHSTQTDLVAGRPFFMVTASMSLDPVLVLHFTQ